MMRKRSATLLQTAALWLLPMAAVAQEMDFDIGEAKPKEPKPIYTSEVELGVGWVSEDSYKFGEYSGLETKGPFIIGNLSLQIRDPYDSGDGEYYTLTGTNLGLESRAIRAEYGKQGKFGLFALYAATPKYLHDDARTPYIISNDGASLTLPANWVPGNRNTAQMTNLVADLQDVNIKYQRQKYGGGFAWLAAQGWTVRSSFTRENKTGDQTIAAIFGSTGGNPAAAIVPEPINYETDNFDVSLGFAGKKGHFVLSYNLSVFRDNNDGLLFQNAYTGPWPASVSYPTGYGLLGLPPDNKAHHVRFAGSYLISPTTRATANISYGHLTQNDPFLPFTINPGILAPIALPRDSLDGEIDTILATFGVTSQVTPKFNMRANYRFEDRDNNTPRDIFVVVPADSANQGTLASSTARINQPYSRKQHMVELEGAYRLSGSTKLTLGYAYDQLERTFSEVSKTKEHSIKGKLNANPSATVHTWVSVEYADRNGSDYDDNIAVISSHTDEFLGPDPEEEFDNHPLMRKYFIADRNRLKVQGSANWLADDKLTFTLVGRYNDDDYNKSTIGLTKSRQFTGTLDASYQVSDAISYQVYYTYQRLRYDQIALSWGSTTPPADMVNFGLRGWTNDIRDKIHTVGFAAEWAAIEDRLDLSFDYYFSRAVTSSDMTAGTALTLAPLPDLKTTLHNIDVKADYHYSKQMWLRLRYQFQSYRVTDYALDGVEPNTMRFAIGLGNQGPDYDVHVIGLSTIYRF